MGFYTCFQILPLKSNFLSPAKTDFSRSFKSEDIYTFLISYKFISQLIIFCEQLLVSVSFTRFLPLWFIIFPNLTDWLIPSLIRLFQGSFIQCIYFFPRILHCCPHSSKRYTKKVNETQLKYSHSLTQSIKHNFRFWFITCNMQSICLHRTHTPLNKSLWDILRCI